MTLSIPPPTQPSVDTQGKWTVPWYRFLNHLTQEADAALPKDGTEAMTAPLPLMTYTVATIPDATLWAGGVIYVSDGATGEKLLASDGTDWVPLDAAAASVLTGDRAYYVRTDGSDSNTGLVDNSGGAFLTIQHAVDVTMATNLNGNGVSINVADGYYAETGGVQIIGPYNNPARSGYLTLIGNITTPGNVVIDSGGSNCIYVNDCYVRIKGFWVGSSVRDGLVADVGAWVGFDNMAFANARHYIRATHGGFIQMFDDFSIEGDANDSGIIALLNGNIELQGGVITVNAGASYTYFVQAKAGGNIEAATNVSFAGGGTGARYLADQNGVVNSGGGGANFFPGTAPGVVGSGGDWGVYV